MEVLGQVTVTTFNLLSYIFCLSRTGGAVKICNNMLLAVTMIGTSESMNLGIKLGLDPKLLASIMGTATGDVNDTC